MNHESSLLNDTNLWYGIAVFVFFALIYKLARKGLLAAIDGQVDKIKNELDEAKRLRAEAEATLVDYRARQAGAMKEAENIVSEAKVLAAKLRKDSEIELAETLRRYEQLALDHIREAQESVAAEVRAYMINEALLEARGKLTKDAMAPESLKLIDKAIADIPKFASGKAV